MELEKGKYWSMTFDSESKVVQLIWTPQTGAMTDDDFKEGVDRFTAHAEQNNAKGLFVDVRDFGHRMSPELGQWRQDKIVPRYNAAGVLRFAYVLPPGAPAVEPKQNEGEDFVTGYFGSANTASEWLAAQ